MAVLLDKLMDMPDPARRYLLVLVQSTDWGKFVFLSRGYMERPDRDDGADPPETSSEATDEA
jgi:hypothetical protein